MTCLPTKVTCFFTLRLCAGMPLWACSHIWNQGSPELVCELLQLVAAFFAFFPALTGFIYAEASHCSTGAAQLFTSQLLHGCWWYFIYFSLLFYFSVFSCAFGFCWPIFRPSCPIFGLFLKLFLESIILLRFCLSYVVHKLLILKLCPTAVQFAPKKIPSPKLSETAHKKRAGRCQP